jgi:hypothetical protein
MLLVDMLNAVPDIAAVKQISIPSIVDWGRDSTASQSSKKIS